MSYQTKAKPIRRTTKKISITRESQKRSAFFGSGKSAVHILDSSWLYQFVFSSRATAIVVVLLCLSILLQPIARVAADEVDETPNNVPVLIEPPPGVEIITAPESTDVFDSEQAVSETSDPIPTNAESLDESDTASAILTEANESDEVATSQNQPGMSGSNSVPIVPSGTSTLIAPPEAPATLSPTTSTTVPPELLGTSSTPVLVSTSTLGAITTVPNNENQLLGSTEDAVDSLPEQPSVASGQSTTSDRVTDELTTDDGATGTFDPAVVNTVQSDNQFSFQRNECTVVEDGSYYCQKGTETDVLEDRLISAPDSDGDLEIYLVRKGVHTQLTFNTVDDAAPYYDHYSDTIVWHRLINDRYHIVSFDVSSQEETLITSGNTNNMEPARHAEYIVWQRWVDSNWEIILYDGTREQQITRSSEHDIAPHMRGSLVIWNSRFDDGRQQLQTYDIGYRTYTVIKDADGVTVSNPRMVVMYEAMYANGDIITKGFDLISGEIVPLQALPRQLPDELPSSEPTGEVRALLQQKSSESLLEEGETTSPPLDPPIDPSIATTSTSSSHISSLPELDLRGPTTSPEIILEELIMLSTTSVITIPDLIIPPLETMSTSTQS